MSISAAQSAARAASQRHTRARLTATAVAVVAGVIFGGVVTPMPARAASVASNAPEVVTFTESSSWTVPQGVSSVSVSVTGGGGGKEVDGHAVGGSGGIISGAFAVEPGNRLYFQIGGAGGSGRDEGGGYSAGGHGGGSGFDGSNGAGGGGSTGVTVIDGESTQLMVLAAGGGGGGGYGGRGGDADVDNAEGGESDAGRLGRGDHGSVGGKGDSSSTGSGGGGGGGGLLPPNVPEDAGLGGGAGGGADSFSTGGGGGGGTSWTDPAVADVVSTPSVAYPGASGSVTLTYFAVPETTISVAPSSVLTAGLGSSIIVDAVVVSSSGATPTGAVKMVMVYPVAGVQLLSGTLDAAGKVTLEFTVEDIGLETVNLVFTPADATAYQSSVSADFQIVKQWAGPLPDDALAPGVSSQGDTVIPANGPPDSVPVSRLAESGVDVRPEVLLATGALLVGIVLFFGSKVRRRRSVHGRR
ncbi:hypothetical protein FHX48_002487 [Microbacterium halimionae]|uniref:Glycine rich protein n=1 Tax=Microbacterium halimionae TaxID=1526413 RepID=A0A7W3JR37_9MICO|nr:hypothetical protein [Microbacterium halimionae]MBA8817388.1 hypothetical protein [Microbacterium halimionae]NII96022.1 hypothetical protein [Microbacterium halimionae]